MLSVNATTENVKERFLAASDLKPAASAPGVAESNEIQPRTA
jgi:hypothetical protein